MTILPVYSGHKIGFEQKLNKISFFLKKGEVLDKKNKTFFASYIYSPKHLQFFLFFLLDSLPRKQLSFIGEKNSTGKIFQMNCIMYLYVSI